jgi:hypothetical protein
LGFAALLAAASGAKVKIAGNELGASGTGARVLTGLVGLLALGWGGWSLRERPFGISTFNGARVTLLKYDSRRCTADIEVAGSVRYRNGPGHVRYEVRIGPRDYEDETVKVFSQTVIGKATGNDLLGPQTIHLQLERHISALWVQIWVVAPDLIPNRPQRIGVPVVNGVRYLERPQSRCARV